MRNIFSKWLSALIRAWNRQFRLDLPEKWKLRARETGREYDAAAFVLLGWAGGALAALLGTLAGWISNSFLGALIFALAGWLFMLFHDIGRGDGLIAAAISEKLPGDSIPFRLLVPIFMMILKFAMLMMLFHHGVPLYLGMVTGGIFALEAMMIMEAGFYPPVLDESERSVRIFRMTLIAMLIVSFISCRLGTALGLLAAALWWRYAREAETGNGMTADTIRLNGAVAGWILLLAGILAI